MLPSPEFIFFVSPAIFGRRLCFNGVFFFGPKTADLQNCGEFPRPINNDKLLSLEAATPTSTIPQMQQLTHCVFVLRGGEFTIESAPPAHWKDVHGDTEN